MLLQFCGKCLLNRRFKVWRVSINYRSYSLKNCQLKWLQCLSFDFCFCRIRGVYWTNDYRRWEWSGVEFHLCNRLFVTHDFIVLSGYYKVYCFCRSQSGSLNNAMVELKWKTVFCVPFDQMVNPRNLACCVWGI